MTLTFAHVHCMHRVLWDVHAHVHHPLIEEMLMCMHISDLSPFTKYVISHLLYIVQINDFSLEANLLSRKSYVFGKPLNVLQWLQLYYWIIISPNETAEVISHTDKVIEH